jgi:hypothetical protein
MVISHCEITYLSYNQFDSGRLETLGNPLEMDFHLLPSPQKAPGSFPLPRGDRQSLGVDRYAQPWRHSEPSFAD